MDAITLTAVARELNETVAGGRIQAVVQPDARSLALEVFGRAGRQWLLFDTQPSTSRVHLLPEKARRGAETDAPFFLLARKRLLGARLVDVFQPAWERILYCGCEHPELGKTTLAAEIMGKWSNLLLLSGEGVIVEALRRFGPDQNPHRPILPGRPYLPPPPQANRIPIDLLTLTDLESIFEAAAPAEPIWRMLVKQVAGISPLTARELAFRATGDVQATCDPANARPQALFDAVVWLRSLPRQGGWAPSIVFADEGDQPLAFAPYELSHLDQYELRPTISAAASDYYTALAGADAYAGRRKQVQALLAAARRRLNGRQISLGEQAISEEEVDEIRSSGEWILAYAWQIRPGDAELLADTGAGVVRIPLDPTLSPSENAQAYFARYHKAKRASGRIPDLLAEADRDLEYLDQLQIDLQLAEDAAQIEELREALLASGLAPVTGKRRPPIQRSQPLRLHTADGFTVIIGRNAVQNERVTWDLAGPEDLWLHTERVPGSHVVIKTEGRAVPESTLRQAAAWAAWQSQARRDGKVSVIHTQRRHLRRIPGGRPGQVRVLQAQSLLVVPLAPE